MQLTRRGYVVVIVVLLAVLAAAGSAYYRHLVNQAVAECAQPAPPEKPVTPPPNLPGFQTEAACGTGEPSDAAKKKKSSAPVRYD